MSTHVRGTSAWQQGCTRGTEHTRPNTTVKLYTAAQPCATTSATLHIRFTREVSEVLCRYFTVVALPQLRVLRQVEHVSNDGRHAHCLLERHYVGHSHDAEEHSLQREVIGNATFEANVNERDWGWGND